MGRGGSFGFELHNTKNKLLLFYGKSFGCTIYFRGGLRFEFFILSEFGAYHVVLLEADESSIETCY